MTGSPTNATTGFGSQLQRYDDLGVTPTSVGEIVDFTPTRKLNTVDGSTMNSPNGWMEKVPTMKDPGSMSVTFHYVPNDPTHQAILLDLGQSFKRKWRIVKPCIPVRNEDFFSYTSNISFAYKHDGILECTMTLDRTGEPIDS